MTLYVCTVCCEEKGEEQQGRSIAKPKSRDAYPIFCTADGSCRLRVPIWREVPEKKQTTIT